MKMDGSQSPVDFLKAELEEMKKQRDEEFGEPDNHEETDSNENSPNEENQDEQSNQVSREETVEYWKHRFDVVQGQQRADSQRSKEMISNLQEQIEELRQSTQTQQTTYTSVEDAIDELQEQYGEEFTKSLDARIERMAKRLIKEETASVNQELITVRNSQKVSEQQMFEENLTKQAPNWQVTNVDPEFVTWLNASTEQLSGLSFYSILMNAYNNRELNKVAQIFNIFTNLKNKTNTNQSSQTSTEQQSLIAPPKRGSQTSATLDNNQGKVFTRSEVDTFYTNLQNGKYKGKEELAKQIKAEIHKANLEGRIV